MKPLSSLGIGLSIIFACLFLALVAEVYYLLWWKKRVVTRGIDDDNSSSAREFVDLFCWKNPSSLISTALNPLELHASAGIANESVDVDSRLKPFRGEDDLAADNFMVFHNLPDLPRLLSTIKEETMEDLESDGSKSRGDISRRISDVVIGVDTPYMTPISSPLFFTPPLTPMNCCYSQHGFNPLFESTKEEEDENWIRASPPPKLKFLRDAEEKLYRKTLMEKAVKVQTTVCGPLMNVVKSGKTSVLIVPSCSPSENREKHFLQPSNWIYPSAI